MREESGENPPMKIKGQNLMHFQTVLSLGLYGEKRGSSRRELCLGFVSPRMDCFS